MDVPSSALCVTGFQRIGRDSTLVRLMSRSAKHARALNSDPLVSFMENAMEVLYGTFGRGGRGSRANARKRVTLLLSSWMSESYTSMPYKSAARDDATAATPARAFCLMCAAAPAVSSTASLTTPPLSAVRYPSHCASACG